MNGRIARIRKMTRFGKEVKYSLGNAVMKGDVEKKTLKSQQTISIFKMKILIHNLNRKKEKKFTELGRRMYDLIQKRVPQILGDTAMKRLIEETRGIEKEIEKAESEIERMRNKVLEENKKPEDNYL